MSDLTERLKARIHAPTFYTHAVGVAGCAAYPAVFQAQPQHFTGTTGTLTVGPDKDLLEAVARIEEMERALTGVLPCRVTCDGGPRFGEGVKVSTLLGYFERRRLYNTTDGHMGENGSYEAEPK